MSTATMIPEGKYNAKIVDYAITSKTESSDPRVEVRFQFEVPGVGLKTRTAYKYFKGGAREWTLKFLATLGLKGNDPSVLVDNHFGSGYLDEESTYEVEIIHEEYNGNVSDKIGWVNRLGIKKADAGSKSRLKNQLGDLRGDMMKAKHDVGAPQDNSPPQQTQQQQSQPQPQQDSLDDVPF